MLEDLFKSIPCCVRLAGLTNWFSSPQPNKAFGWVDFVCTYERQVCLSCDCVL